MVYDNLDQPARLQIWRTLCKKVSCDVAISDDEYIQLSAQEFRRKGLAIKNIVTLAEALALGNNKPLGFEHLRKFIKESCEDIESGPAPGKQQGVNHTATSLPKTLEKGLEERR